MTRGLLFSQYHPGLASYPDHFVRNWYKHAEQAHPIWNPGHHRCIHSNLPHGSLQSEHVISGVFHAVWHSQLGLTPYYCGPRGHFCLEGFSFSLPLVRKREVFAEAAYNVVKVVRFLATRNSLVGCWAGLRI